MPLIQNSLQGLWLKALLFALFGYALLGKGFAYLYLGEAILFLGILIFIKSGRFMVLFSDSVLFLWALFAFWGLCRTLPFLSRYGFNAARDAVLWGYGICALLIVTFVNSSPQISRALNIYRRFLKWYIPILPALLLISLSFRAYVPKLPWSGGVGIILLYADGAGAQLAAAAIFWMVFSDRPSRWTKRSISIPGFLQFAAWAMTALLVVVTTRAGFLAIVCPILLVSVLKAQRVGWKVAALTIAGVVFGVLLLAIVPSTVQVKGHTITADHIVEMGGSAVGLDTGVESHQGTAGWRLIWWTKIIHYTVLGPDFWTGKGFGVNLALDDGVPNLTEDTTLRSPHNGNMTVLARMGVPGLFLWVALNATFVIRLVMAYKRAVRSGSRLWSGVNLWILCFWLSFFIIMGFSVVLEGPYGGIWFWSIIGFGVAAMRVQKHEARQLSASAHLRDAEAPVYAAHVHA